MPRQLTVLVADDHNDMRMIISRFIERLGHVVIAARNGVEALAAFTTHNPDIVLLDVQMPEMDGYETTLRIRQLNSHTWTPIVFLSARGEEEGRVKGLEVGGDDYLAKPISFPLLGAKIATLQRFVELQQRLYAQVERDADRDEENEGAQRGAKRLMEPLQQTDTGKHAEIQERSTPVPSHASDLPQWEFRLRLGAAELKSVNVGPVLMAWLKQVNIGPEQREQIFLIVAELFKNALDHGVLELDSRLKDRADGFEEYMRGGSERLSALQAGQIDIALESLWQAEGQFLRIHVKDSGRGFDHTTVMQHNIAPSTAHFGRGIALVREFCEQVTYLGNGNAVVALYRLG